MDGSSPEHPAPSGTAVRPASRRALWWLLLPVVGLVELGAQVTIDAAVPPMSDWEAAAQAIRKEHKPGDLVVIAPEWATHGRLALRELMPLEDQARADASTYSRLWEVSIRNSEALEAKGLRSDREQRFGKVRVRRFMLPPPAKVRYRFLHHVADAQVSTLDASGSEQPCDLTAGTVQWRCNRMPWSWVGPIVIDDLEYRPRQAIWAHPMQGVVTRLVFPNVPAGKRIRGYTGIRYLGAREGGKPPVRLDVFVDGVKRLQVEHHDEDVWKRFEVPLEHVGSSMEVRFEVSCKATGNRHFAFVADVRD